MPVDSPDVSASALIDQLFDLRAAPTESLVTTIAGTVVDAVFCGDTIRVTLNTPAGQFVSTQKHNGNAPLSVAGQSVEVWWRKDDIVRFDAAGQATTV